MKFFLILSIGLIVILFGNHIITSDSGEPQAVVLGNDNKDLIAPVDSINKEVIKKRDDLVDSAPELLKPSLTPIIDSSKIVAIKKKEYIKITKYEESYIKNKQNEIKLQILRLDNDVQNREMQLELSSSLKEASEYRKNILIKSKQDYIKAMDVIVYE